MPNKPSGDISPEPDDQEFLDEVVRSLRERAGGRIPVSWQHYLSDTLKEPYKPTPKKRGRKPCTDKHVAMAKEFEVETMWGVSKSRRDPRPVRSIEERLAKKHGVSLNRFRDARFKYKNSPEVEAARKEELEKAAAEVKRKLDVRQPWQPPARASRPLKKSD